MRTSPYLAGLSSLIFSVHGVNITSASILSSGAVDLGIYQEAYANETAVASKYPTGRLSVGGYADLFDEIINVSTTISNTGLASSKEVAQLYVSYPSIAAQPPQQLRGFEKVYLEAGATTLVSFSVRRRDVSYWDVEAQQWALASGMYTFAVGASSRDIRASVTVTL